LAAVFQDRSGVLGWALTLIQTFSISVGFFPPIIKVYATLFRQSQLTLKQRPSDELSWSLRVCASFKAAGVR
jgi:hypothetical protein